MVCVRVTFWAPCLWLLERSRKILGPFWDLFKLKTELPWSCVSFRPMGNRNGQWTKTMDDCKARVESRQNMPIDDPRNPLTQQGSQRCRLLGREAQWWWGNWSESQFPLDFDKEGKDPKKHLPPPTLSTKQEQAAQREHRTLKGYLRAGLPSLWPSCTTPGYIHPQDSRLAHPRDAHTSMYTARSCIPNSWDTGAA